MLNEEVLNDGHDVNDLTDMWSGLRVMLPSAQLLTAFLLTLPFNSGFARVAAVQRWHFMVAFVCALSSLVLFSAPAIQHRQMRPIRQRAKFKQLASRQIVGGSMMLSLALIVGTHFVTAEVFGDPVDNMLTILVTILIVVFWWILPKVLRDRLA